MDKEFYRLWYEYLKRSDNYRNFIKANRPITDAIRDSLYLAKIWNKIGRDPVLSGHFINLATFGDVFKTPFDTWYKRRLKDQPFWIAVETKKLIRSYELQFAIGQIHHPDPNIISCLDTLSYYDHPKPMKRLFEEENHQFINISVNLHASDREIRDAVSKIVAQRKKKQTPSLESLQDYLATYDLFHATEPLPKKEIARRILSEDNRKQDARADKEETDRIDLYHKRALAIIRNVEAGNIFFPGKI